MTDRLLFEWLAPTAASLLLLAVVFVPLERLFPARPGQRIFRAEVATDLFFFLGQYLAFATLATSVLGLVHRQLVPSLAAIGTRDLVAALPVPVQGAIALIFGDFLVYWFHRACHSVPLLWRFHAVHHSVEHLDWLAAHREHPLDGIATQLLLNLPGMLLGVSFEAMGAIVVLRGMWAIFIHSNVSLPVGPLRYVLGEPALHHFHHARVPETKHNFANLAPYLDLAFGTYHRPDKEDYELGLVDPRPRGYVAQLIHPLLPSKVSSPATERASAS